MLILYLDKVNNYWDMSFVILRIMHLINLYLVHSHHPSPFIIIL